MKQKSLHTIIIFLALSLVACGQGEFESTEAASSVVVSNDTDSPVVSSPLQPMPTMPQQPQLPQAPAPVTSGSFTVNPLCEAPASSFRRSLYIDPNRGSDSTGDGSQGAPYQSLNYVLNQKIIAPGDHVHLLPGSYGAININGANSSQLVNSREWTWFDFKPGATSGFVDVRGMSRLIISGLTAQGLAVNRYVISVGFGSNHVIVADNAVSSGASANLTATEWMALASGISIANTHCGTVLRNKIRHVRHGFGVGFSGSTYPANSCKILLQENDLQHFSGDGTRLNCSDLMVIRNRMVDGYVSGADGDGNHDDFMQGFALNGAVYENLLVEGNYLQDRSTANRALLSDYQGISVFDGLFKNVVVRKNVVVGGAYHGINFAGVDTALIENNTVITSGSKKYWIAAPASKTGVPSVNVTIRHNLATHINTTQGHRYSNNFNVSNPQAEFVSFDLQSGFIDMNLKTSSQFFNSGAGAF